MPTVSEAAEVSSDTLLKQLTKIAADILQVETADIDQDEFLREYGFDTVKFTDFSEEIARQLDEKILLNSGDFVEYPSINRLAEHILEQTPYTGASRPEHDEQGSDWSLTDMLYTLQIGRDAMEQRLAIVASSPAELAKKIQAFVQDKTSIEGLYQSGQATASHETDRSPESIAKALQDKDSEQLAKLWASGVDIDWKSLYPGKKPHRLSLPAYPFAKTRYWFAEADADAGNAVAPVNYGTVYFKPQWQVEALHQPAESPNSPVLLISSNQNLAKRLTAINQAENSKVIRVKPAEEYAAVSKDEYTIDAQNPAHYQQVFKALDEALDKKLPGRVVYCLMQDELHASAGIAEAANASVLLPLFYLARELLIRKPQNQIQLLVAGICEPDSIDYALVQALNGFMKTLQLENSRFSCKSVMFDTSCQAGEAAALINQEFPFADLKEVCYRQKERLVKNYRPQQSVSEDKDSIPFRSGGVYLITGGAGGLGLIFAAHLAENYQARLILSGRSALSAETAQKLEQIKQSGGEIHYIQSDVSEEAAVSALISRIMTLVGELNGILHCAGVIEDAYILKKDPQTMADVLAPKVSGTVYLDQATQANRLDFFVLFSSITAIVGNLGQSDYAYANAFMDHYAHYRQSLCDKKQRHGRTLALNWPLWEHGGMQADEKGKQLMFQLAGMLTLETEAGIKALMDGLAEDMQQFLVMQGEPAKLQQRLDSLPSAPSFSGAISESLRHKIQDEVLRKVSGIVKADIDEINPDEEMSEYGFDSVMLTELANQFNHQYQLDLTPAILYEYPTLNDFSAFLAETYGDKFAEYHGEDLAGDSSQASEVLQAADVAGVAGSQRPRWEPGVPSAGLEGDTRSRSFQDRGSQAGAWEPAQAAHAGEPIAIVGMSGTMPGSPDLASFWKHLAAGEDLIQEIPEDRWNWRDYYGDPSTEPNKSWVKWGGFMDEVDRFDAMFFGVSPKEARLMDPQQRLFLQTVWHAIEDAGIKPSDLSGSQTGLFVGVTYSDYYELIKQHINQVDADVSTGVAHAILPNRVSFRLNLHGPSEPIDTACSSSLVAIHRAVNAIYQGDCECAIAGGVNVLLNPMVFLALSKGGMLSPDGRCKTFDKSANGFTRGEGVGAVFLKPLKQAEADGNPVYAVIKSTAENHGGHAKSLTSPNPNAQAELLIKAYDKAQVSPDSIGYIEAHGTGTSLGDPIEINGLKKAFAQLYKKRGLDINRMPHCGLGSVKSNIGHLEPAAGIAGILKILMMLRNKTLPATLHLKELNPYIDLAHSPFYMVDTQRPWKSLQDKQGRDMPRRAGISAFGFGGSNAHVVLEEYPEAIMDHGPGSFLIVLSAKNEERLKAYAEKLSDFVSEPNSYGLANISWTLQSGREAMEERLAITADSHEQLKNKLKQYIDGKPSVKGLYQGNVKKEKKQTRLLLDGDAGKAYINVVIQSRDIDKLANLWISGVEFDWSLLYPQGTPKLVSLPGYPFAKKRYWVTDISQTALADKSSAEPAAVKTHKTEQKQPAKAAAAGQGISAEPAAVKMHKAEQKQPAQAAAEGQVSPETISVNEIFARLKRMDSDEILPQKSRPVLLFSANRSLAECLQKQTGIIWVKPADAYAKTAENHYELNPEIEEHYRQLMQAASDSKQMPHQVIYNPDVDADEKRRQGGETADRLLQPLVYMHQNLQNIAPDRFIQTQTVIASETETAKKLLAAAQEHGRVTHEKHPDVHYKTVLMSKESDPEKLAGMIMRELPLSAMQETDVCYTYGEREVKSCQSLRNPYELFRGLNM
ncbi:MAG: SDR family NAD(P)-dependent oxidoreductase [Gammaproteobacteria bacterium]|nr:SDR family NAD(P)-dependent oxidoreductase [Gammaproteobacteria bacterium]